MDHQDPRVAALRVALHGLRPADGRERRSIAEFVAALERLPRPFDEHAGRTHVTASGIVVGPRGVLLHRHKRIGLWIQPGGHVDPGETPAEAAVRETREETGLAVHHPDGGPRLVHVDAHDGGRGHRHLDLRYLLLAGDDPPDPPPGESQDVAWYSWEDATGRADLGLVAALQGLRPEFA